MSKKIDMTGKRINRITVLYQSGHDKWSRAVWMCRCDCGAEYEVLGNTLRCQSPTACYYCTRNGGAPIKTFGESTYPFEYKSWTQMKQRCLNSNDPSYKYYGDKGVIVCDRWINSFENFLLDMGERPEPKEKFSIERKDVFGNYCPENCIWLLKIEQHLNRRKGY